MSQFDDVPAGFVWKVDALFKTTSGHEDVGKKVREE